MPNPITAAEQSILLGEGSGIQPVPPASAWGIIRMVLTLAFVAVAIYGLVFLLKRASRGTAIQDPFLKILASTPLGANRSAHVISVGSRAWLVGSAESGINLISEIQDMDIVDAMLLEDSRRNAAHPSGRFLDFRAMLRKLGMPIEASAPGPEDIRKRRERLKGL